MTTYLGGVLSVQSSSDSSIEMTGRPSSVSFLLSLNEACFGAGVGATARVRMMRARLLDGRSINNDLMEHNINNHAV